MNFLGLIDEISKNITVASEDGLVQLSVTGDNVVRLMVASDGNKTTPLTTESATTMMTSMLEKASSMYLAPAKIKTILDNSQYILSTFTMPSEVLQLYTDFSKHLVAQTQGELSKSRNQATQRISLSQDMIASMLNITSSLLNTSDCNSEYMTLLDANLQIIDDLSEFLLKDVRIGGSVNITTSKYYLFCIKEKYMFLKGSEYAVNQAGFTIVLPAKLTTKIANLPKIRETDIISFQFIQWFENPVAACANDSNLTAPKFDIRLNRLNHPGRDLLVPAAKQQFSIFDPDKAINCSEQGASCIPVRTTLARGSQSAWGCNCSASDLDLRAGVKGLVTNINKLKQFDVIFSLQTLAHPVFLALTGVGSVIVILILFYEEKPYVTTNYEGKSWVKIFFLLFVYYHPFLGVFFHPETELSPRKRLMLYFTRVSMSIGFSSVIQLGTDFSRLSVWSTIGLAFGPTITTTLTTRVLSMFLAHDPTSINTLKWKEEGASSMKIVFIKWRIFLGGMITLLFTGASYYCIVAISLLSPPAIVDNWVRVLITSLVQDQIVSQLIRSGISLLLCFYIQTHPTWRFRGEVVRYLLQRDIVRLVESKLNITQQRRRGAAIIPTLQPL
jgi:hypothetical protein